MRLRIVRIAPVAWDFSTEPEFEEKLEWMRALVRDEILPLETLDLDHDLYRALIRPLQERVKREGLWAAHLSPELGGGGYGQVKLALMHEVLGASELAPPVFGNQAPDSGNSELIALAATEAQKEQWLWPLLDGRLQSAFSMTEQGTGSDPTQLTTRAVREGDEWVITGTKWFISNALWADFHLVLAVTDPAAAPRDRTSILIVPADTPGISARELGSMGHPRGAPRHPVHHECEVCYDGVRVPVENLLGGEGEAFVLAQKRLGPGRIHHAMRWLGICRRAFDAMCERAVSVELHGGRLADKQLVQDWVALSAAAMASMRMLTLYAAWKIDQVGAESAREEISMIKYHGAQVMLDVVDRALQLHGSFGYSSDLPFEEMLRWARASRFYDGPDEVHKVIVARRILRRYEPVSVPTEHVPSRRERALERYSTELERLGAARSARST
jgi:acyl-CoA dehydrogenase